MRLVTIQPLEVLEQLVRYGRYVCDGEKAGLGDNPSFKEAYDWMAIRMSEYVGEAPRDTRYPIWAWYKNDDDFSDWNHDGKAYAKIELEVEDSRVLLSDFDDWNCILNGGPVLKDDEESCEESEIRKTWGRVFHSDGDYVQATLWELYSEDIWTLQLFTSTEKTEESE